MKVIIKLFVFLIPLFFGINCSKEDRPKQVPQLSDIITGQWHYTQYMGWPENPENEWHPAEDSTLIIQFKTNGNIIYRFANSGNMETGTYEVIDSSSSINILLESTLPYEFIISEFTELMFIREYQTDEGFVKEQYEKLE